MFIDICKNSVLAFTKGLIYLALMDSDKWNKTAHAKSCIVDNSPNCRKCLFEYLSVLLFDQLLLEKLQSISQR